MAADQKEPKKAGVMKYLDNTFSDEGLRTDVKITLTNETIVKFVAAVVAASALGTMIHFMVKGMFTTKVK